MSFKHLTLLLACFLFASAGRAADQADLVATRIRIGGSGGPLEGMRLLGEAFKKIHPQTTVVIVPSLGSGGGIKALRAEAIDLAVTSRPLKEAERSPDLIATSYARTPFVFATAWHSNLSAITTAELVGIYAGERKTWPDGRPLRLVLRPETESDTDIVKSLSPEMNQAVKAALDRDGMIVALADKANADKLESIPGAIGATTLAQIISEKRALQPLVLNGVTPSLAALAEGKYPYYKTFFMVTGPKTSPLTHQFTLFVRSAAGREILEKNGHLMVFTK